MLLLAGVLWLERSDLGEVRGGFRGFAASLRPFWMGFELKHLTVAGREGFSASLENIRNGADSLTLTPALTGRARTASAISGALPRDPPAKPPIAGVLSVFLAALILASVSLFTFRHRARTSRLH
jgi:hypothetical protein